MRICVYFINDKINIFYNLFFKIMFFYKNFVFCDAAEQWQLGLQDPATPVMEGIINFHNHLMFFMVFIAMFVFWMLSRIITYYDAEIHPKPEKFTHSTVLEVVWTIIPATILLIIAIPSFALLYSLDEMIDPAVTLKVVGHQWYWSYEYSDYASLEGGDTLNFDSYLLPKEEFVPGVYRLLEADLRTLLPIKTHIRVLVTSSDVLHSWAVPSFGIKVDACPGRLTQASLFIKRVGVYFGQCSEICGVNHAFMPIVAKGVTVNRYISWIAIRIDGIKI